jgi:HEPN domain-containing protein
MKEGLSFFPQICWHFQQAAEKYLKAYILACELEFRKIHDLVALLKICQAHEPSFESLFESCTYLHRFYVETRYPVAWEVNYSLEDTLKAQNATQQIKEFTTKHLPPL